MHLDVVDLKAFYYRTRLGRVAQRAVRTKLREFWPSVNDETIVGFGFAAPMLRPFLPEARRTICLMPGPQGVMAWPSEQENIAVLCEDHFWPMPTGSIDRLVVMHGLETSENPGSLLDEIWRVLKPGGRVMFILPNRSGLWSQSDATPFGYGRPYSFGQIESQLRKHRFLVEHHKAALFSPPSQKLFWLRMAPVLERVGQAISSQLAGGALLVEATKQIYAPTQKGLPEMVRRPFDVLKGVSRPVPEPASSRDSAEL